MKHLIAVQCFLALSLALFVCFIGCNGNANTPAPPAINSPLIRSTGKYVSPDGRFEVVVTTRSKSLIDYAISNSESQLEMASGGGFSDAQRWHLFWDKQNQLWEYNSDMGGFGYWQYSDEDTSFDFVKVGKADQSLVPQPVFDNLPNSLRRGWGWQ